MYDVTNRNVAAQSEPSNDITAPICGHGPWKRKACACSGCGCYSQECGGGCHPEGCHGRGSMCRLDSDPSRSAQPNCIGIVCDVCLTAKVRAYSARGSCIHPVACQREEYDVLSAGIVIVDNPSSVAQCSHPYLRLHARFMLTCCVHFLIL